MTFHLNSVTNPAKVVIRTSDNDILAIKLSYMGRMSSEIKVPFVFCLVNWYYFYQIVISTSLFYVKT